MMAPETLDTVRVSHLFFFTPFVHLFEFAIVHSHRHLVHVHTDLHRRRGRTRGAQRRCALSGRLCR
jgi:hypothetical protein